MVDRIQIYERPTGLLSPALLYDNIIKDDQWNHPPRAAEALVEGRDRPWTPDEQTAFALAIQAVAEQMRQRGVTQEDIDTFLSLCRMAQLTYRTAQPADARLLF